MTPIVAVSLIFGLNLVDVLTTKLILSNGGIEANPIMAPVVETNWGYGLKLGIAAVITIRIWALWGTEPNRARGTAYVILFLYAGVVGWNVTGIG